VSHLLPLVALALLAHQTFTDHPDIDKVYGTADGNIFLPSSENAARNHSKQEKLDLHTITRSESEQAFADSLDDEPDFEDEDEPDFEDEDEPDFEDEPEATDEAPAAEPKATDEAPAAEPKATDEAPAAEPKATDEAPAAEPTAEPVKATKAKAKKAAATK
jgi:hypothetical protein